MVTHQEKVRITEAVQLHIDRYGSQNQAAYSLKKVSPATLHQMVHEVWEQISDSMWRNVGAQLGISGKDWNIVQTHSFTRIQELLSDAKEESIVFGMVGSGGVGKSEALRHFVLHNKEAYYVRGTHDMDRRTFLAEINRVIGQKPQSHNISRTLSDIVHNIKTKDSPVFIFDEFDKVPESVFLFLITLYNEWEDQCGIVISGSHHLKNRITNGINRNKRGYDEIDSRLGRKLIPITPPSSSDIAQIAAANGITHKDHLKVVIEDSQQDIRRVKRKVFAINKKLRKNEGIAQQALDLLTEGLLKRHQDTVDKAKALIDDNERFEWKGLEPMLEKWVKMHAQAEKDIKKPEPVTA